MTRVLIAGLVILVLTSLAVRAQDRQKDDRISITYDVGDLIGKPILDAKSDTLAELIRIIQSSVNPHAWLPDQKPGNDLYEINGKRLAISASRKDHEQIKELLETIRRLQDLTVAGTASFYAIDPSVLPKDTRDTLEKGQPGMLDEEVLAKVKQGAPIQSRQFRFIPDGKARPLASLRKMVAYVGKPVPENPAVPNWSHILVGTQIEGKWKVSADRRGIRVELTETESILDPTKKDMDGVPATKKTTYQLSTEVDDGISFLVPVRAAPPSVVKKGHLYLLLVEPYIRIEAEEKLRNGDKKDG